MAFRMYDSEEYNSITEILNATDISRSTFYRYLAAR
ncbi:helix-turn-helix domain-containing protein [Virgibacillus necropolis]